MNDLRTKARAVRGQSFALRNSSLVANSACWRPEASRRPWCRSAPRAGRDGVAERSIKAATDQAISDARLATKCEAEFRKNSSILKAQASRPPTS